MDTTNSAPSGEADERIDLPRILVRNSRDNDVPGMLAIYLHHIRRGVDPGVDGEFETPDAEDIILQHKQFPLVRGIRTKPVISDGPGKSVRGQPRSLQDPKWRNGLSLLAKHDLSWDLRVVWWRLEEAA